MSTHPILGIDPGTVRTGWGVVSKRGTRLTSIDAGVICVNAKLPLETRLRAIYVKLVEVIEEHRPSAVVVEDIFYAKHASAALKLGHARGVALLAAANSDLVVVSYAPALVKRTVAGRGQAGKDQVGRLVSAVLGLREKPPADAADALAVAITHLTAARIGSASRAPGRRRTGR